MQGYAPPYRGCCIPCIPCPPICGHWGGGVMTYRPRSLSYSQIDLYTRCPAAWARRYIHGVKNISPPLTFGSCFASALEAEHRGQDGDVHWVRAYAAEQAAGNLPPGSPTIEMGLRLLALYRQRGVLTGQPEHRWSLYLPNRSGCAGCAFTRAAASYRSSRATRPLARWR
jgi:hypothetical protein